MKKKMELPPTTTGNPENKNMYLVRANYSTNGNRRASNALFHRRIG